MSIVLGTRKVREAEHGKRKHNDVNLRIVISQLCICTWCFSGKERDAESGLDYFGARYLSGAQGRFTTVDPLMASAHASDPQTWNRYTYTLNNPLRFVDPDGMEVPESCAKDPNCKIKINVNVVYNANTNGGKGLTQEQKKYIETKQVEKAKKDYQNSNIQLDVTYSTGSITYNSDGSKTLIGGKADALNVFVTSNSFNGSAGSSSRSSSGEDAIMFYLGSAHDWNVAFLSGNTFEHELGHTLLDHSAIGSGMGLVEKTFVNVGLDIDVNSRIWAQSYGIRQNDFRTGTIPLKYAAPVNPEAIKPKK